MVVSESQKGEKKEIKAGRRLPSNVKSKNKSQKRVNLSSAFSS